MGYSRKWVYGFLDISLSKIYIETPPARGFTSVYKNIKARPAETAKEIIHDAN